MIWRENLKLDDRCKDCSRAMKEHTLMTVDEFEASSNTNSELHVCDLIASLEGEIALRLLCIGLKGEESEAENPCTKAYLEDISTETSE